MSMDIETYESTYGHKCDDACRRVCDSCNKVFCIDNDELSVREYHDYSQTDFVDFCGTCSGKK